jgi:hypothetical protein
MASLLSVEDTVPFDGSIGTILNNFSFFSYFFAFFKSSPELPQSGMLSCHGGAFSLNGVGKGRSIRASPGDGSIA